MLAAYSHIINTILFCGLACSNLIKEYFIRKKECIVSAAHNSCEKQVMTAFSILL
jgi:hypothetical protein